MEIKYLGHSSFLIKAKNIYNAREEAKLVTDPFNPEFIGLRFPKTEADIVTISHQHQDHNNLQSVQNDPLVIDMPGEFEKKGFRVFGYPSFHDDKKGVERGENVVYKIESEGISVLHCGDLGTIPDDNFIDNLGDINILLVPTGGFYTIDSEQAVQLVRKIEPSIVIPMHYATEKHKPEIKNNLEPVEVFLQKMAVDKMAPIPKLIVKKEDLLNEEMKVVLLEI